MNRRREALPVPRFSKLLSLLALLALCAASAKAQGLAVARVVDGDTFELSDGRTVRLVGIDTPEKHMSGKLRSDAEETGRRAEVIQALGRAASQEAKRLAGGKRVELEYDQNNASSKWLRSVRFCLPLQGSEQIPVMLYGRPLLVA